MKRKHKVNIRNSIIGAVLSAFLYFTGLILWWQFYPYEVAIVQQPISLENEEGGYLPGDTIHMTVVVKKSSDYRAESIDVTAQCNNSDTYGLTRVSQAERLAEGTFVRKRLFVLDPNIPEGLSCVGVFDLRYKVNPIRTVTNKWFTEPFETKVVE